jgi:hypothetical protein
MSARPNPTTSAALPTLPSGSIRHVDSAFYEPAGPGTFASTAATVGPWTMDAQHGGPPSALAARALELHEPDERQRLSRVSVDILRPVPVAKLSIRTRTLRPGRRITLIEAVIEAEGQEVLHARGWRIERPAGDVPSVTHGGASPGPVPLDHEGALPEIFGREQHGYLAAIEWRFGPVARAAQPGHPGGPVRAAWTRPRMPLLPDEEPSAFSRALLVADSGSGVGAVLPASDFIFINVDLTVVLPRDPVGEWLLLEAGTTVGADGTGLATTRLSDPIGTFGHAWQTLLVAPR